MQAAIYIRRSREEQSEYSPEAQERQCRLYCELQGYVLHKIYVDDDYSGRLADRPAFERMLHDARLGKVKVIVVHKLDRYARNAALLLRTIEELERLGVRFVSVSEQVDFSTPMGRMVLTTLAGVAEYYSNNLGTETRKGLQEKAQQGGWVGPVPLGYCKNTSGQLVPDEQYAPVVQRIFSDYASGIQSYTSIADSLNTEGYRTLNGKLFGRETIRTILRNRAYLGYVSCSGVEYAGQHTPLISTETWAAAAQVRSGRQSGNHGQHTIRSGGLLTNIIYCAHCGERLWYHRSAHNRYYRCSGLSHRTCSAPMSRADLVEQQALDLLNHLVLPADLLNDVVAAAELLLQQRETTPRITPEHIQERLRRLGVSYRLGDLKDHDYLDERARLQSLLASVPAPIQNLHQAAHALATLGNWLNAANQNDRRTIVCQIFNRVWVEKKGIQVIEPTSLYRPLVEALAEVCGGCLTGVRLAPHTWIGPQRQG